MTCEVRVNPDVFAMLTGKDAQPSGEVDKPPRAIVFLFGEGEKITGARIRDRLIARDYVVVHRPVVEGQEGRVAAAVTQDRRPPPTEIREPTKSACGWCYKMIFWTVEGDDHYWGKCIDPVAAEQRRAVHERA